ncbi:MAG: hypothetical protein A4E48_01976 [Methanosaeta sp. PtaU1.Bin060]|nr:MAG: hypothetical protein A4E48_01976 [Methanosaeta sp. PtaU1.Bin060]
MYDGQSVSFQSLQALRDIGPHSSRNASKGALIQETFILFKELDKINIQELRDNVFIDNCLHKKSFQTRRRIWNDLYYRYLYIAPEWVGLSIAATTAKGITSPEYISLTYLYYSLRDRLTFDFITSVIWDKWQTQVTSVNREDVLLFLEAQSSASQQITQWHESTRKKLSSNMLSALRDFGILRGIQKKYIQRPPVAPETVYHLLCVLKAEGKEGIAIIDAPDWRLFLWNESDISNALADLAQRKWIRFEKSGRTTMLELVRLPEVSYERGS